MSRDGNLLWSIGLAMALTSVAAVTAVVEKRPHHPVVSASTVAAQPVSIAQLGRPRVTGLGD